MQAAIQTLKGSLAKVGDVSYSPTTLDEGQSAALFISFSRISCRLPCAALDVGTGAIASRHAGTPPRQQL
jgi:hypothetical protein